MKEMKNKVKRRKVDWREFLRDQGNLEMEGQFWLMVQKHPRMSKNRIAYNVLRRYYSTTSLLRVRFLGHV